MPDQVGVTPQAETLQVPNTVYRRPEDPLKALAHKVVPGTQGGGPPLGAPVYQFNPAPTQEPEEYATQEATEASQSHENEDGDGGPTPEVKGSPYARLRVLERERNLERQENNALREQLSVLAKAIEKSGLLEEEEVEEEPLDPISRLAKGQEKVMQEVQSIKEAYSQEVEQKAISAEEAAANAQIREFVAKANELKPGLYQEATAHLVNVWISEELENDDSMSFDKAKEVVNERIAKIKSKSYKSGKNPGEEFMKRAVLHGFDIDKAVGGKNGKVSTQVGKPKADDAASKIAAQKARQESLASIATVQGSPVNDPMKNLSAMPEKDRVRAIMQQMKESGNSRRPPLLSATLAHKIRR